MGSNPVGDTDLLLCPREKKQKREILQMHTNLLWGPDCWYKCGLCVRKQLQLEPIVNKTEQNMEVSKNNLYVNLTSYRQNQNSRHCTSAYHTVTICLYSNINLTKSESDVNKTSSRHEHEQTLFVELFIMVSLISFNTLTYTKFYVLKVNLTHRSTSSSIKYDWL